MSKWDNNLLDDIQIVVLDDGEMSGSTSSKKIDLKELEDENSNVEVKFIKNPAKEQIIIPMEKFSGRMSPNEEKAYREYKRQQFPELFDIEGLENDKASEVPSLALTRSARVFATLLEAKLKEKEKERKNKTMH